jgi:hypothetical protein
MRQRRLFLLLLLFVLFISITSIVNKTVQKYGISYHPVPSILTVEENTLAERFIKTSFTSRGIPIFKLSPNLKTTGKDLQAAEILLKVALNTKNQIK